MGGDAPAPVDGDHADRADRRRPGEIEDCGAPAKREAGASGVDCPAVALGDQEARGRETAPLGRHETKGGARPGQSYGLTPVIVYEIKNRPLYFRPLATVLWRPTMTQVM